MNALLALASSSSDGNNILQIALAVLGIVGLIVGAIFVATSTQTKRRLEVQAGLNDDLEQQSRFRGEQIDELQKRLAVAEDRTRKAESDLAVLRDAVSNIGAINDLAIKVNGLDDHVRHLDSTISAGIEDLLAAIARNHPH